MKILKICQFGSIARKTQATAPRWTLHQQNMLRLIRDLLLLEFRKFCREVGQLNRMRRAALPLLNKVRSLMHSTKVQIQVDRIALEDKFKKRKLFSY
jgi:hypothetical protein